MYIYTCSSVAKNHALYLSACEKKSEREAEKKENLQEIRQPIFYVSNS
jgi:hypothetical protein